MIADKDNYLKEFSFLNGKLQMKDKERFYNNGDPLNGITKIGDSFLNVNYSEREQHSFEFVIINADGTRKYIGQIPDWDKSTSASDLTNMFVYQSTHIARPGHKEFAEFYNRFRKIRFLDTKGNILYESEMNYPTKADKVPDSEGIFYMYGEACASSEMIVVKAINSYLGEDHSKNALEECSEFQIWDWEGRIIKRIITRCRLSHFTVDFKTGLMYGVNRDKDNKIYIVDLSQYLWP